MKNFLLLLLFALGTLLFRVPVAIILLASLAITEFVYKNFSYKKFFGLVIFFALIMYLFYSNIEIITHYIGLTNPNLAGEDRISSGIIIQTLIVISGFFGPFPTILPAAGHEADSLWAASLILKVFISIYFIYGTYFVFKSKKPYLISLTIMCLLMIFSLIFVKNTFKVRYIMPYLPMFFIIAGYSYDILKQNKKYKFLRKTILPVNILLSVVILYWNLLRL